MIDLLLLGGLFFFTTCVSYLLYFLHWNGQPIFPGGIWWGTNWLIVSATVAALEGLSVAVTGRTLTRHIKQWAKESEQKKWIARGVVISFMIGALLLGIHLWPM